MLFFSSSCSCLKLPARRFSEKLRQKDVEQPHRSLGHAVIVVCIRRGPLARWRRVSQSDYCQSKPNMRSFASRSSTCINVRRCDTKRKKSGHLYSTYQWRNSSRRTEIDRNSSSCPERATHLHSCLPPSSAANLISGQTPTELSRRPSASEIAREPRTPFFANEGIWGRRGTRWCSRPLGLPSESQEWNTMAKIRHIYSWTGCLGMWHTASKEVFREGHFSTENVLLRSAMPLKPRPSTQLTHFSKAL